MTLGLFIFDFDHTIADGHTHNALSSVTSSNLDTMWELIQSILPVGGVEIWRKIFCQLSNDQHVIAIASFNAYGPMLIPMYLEKMIGLSHEAIEKIHIESWLPFSLENADKNKHIQAILHTMDYRAPKNTVVLVDDEHHHIHMAAQEGYRTILADASHMDKIIALSSELNVKKNQTQFFKRNTAIEKSVNSKFSPCNIL